MRAQSRILEWVAISSYRGPSWPRDQTCSSRDSCSGWQVLYHWAIWEFKATMLLFSCSVLSNYLRPQGLQRARLPYILPSPRAYSNSCPLSQWCHPTISSSVTLFFICLQSLPASGPFLMSQFTSGGQSIGVSASALVLPMNNQDWFPLELTGLISLQSMGPSRVFSDNTVQWCSHSLVLQHHNSSLFSLLYGPTLTSIGEGNGNPLQYYCLKNPMDRGAQWATGHRVAKSQTLLKWLSTYIHTRLLEKLQLCLDGSL